MASSISVCSVFGLAMMLSPYATGTKITSAIKAHQKNKIHLTQNIPSCFSAIPDAGESSFQHSL